MIKDIYTLITGDHLTKDDIGFITPSAKHALIKEVIRKSETTSDVAGSFLVVYDFFTMKKFCSNQHYEKIDFILNNLMESSGSLKAFTDAVSDSIDDPAFIKELDGFLTTRFNEITTRISDKTYIHVTSLMSTYKDIYALKDDDIGKKVCLEAMYIIYTTILKTNLLLNEGIVKDTVVKKDVTTTKEVLNTVKNYSGMYYNISEDTLWLPLFMNETILVLNEKGTVNSFKSYVKKSKEKDAKNGLALQDYEWLKVVQDLEKDPILGKDYRDTRLLRIFLNDPYSEKVDYKLILPYNGKPVLY